MLKRVSPLAATAALLVTMPMSVSAYANRTPPRIDLTMSTCDDAAGPYVLHLYWDESAGKPTEYQADPDPSFYRVTAADLKVGHIDVATPAAGSYSVQLMNKVGGDIHDVSCP